MNEKNRLTKCEHCNSDNIEEVGGDIYCTEDGDVISELQYMCYDCKKISCALNSARNGEFFLDLGALLR